MKKIIIVGGVAGGATAAARLRRLSEDDQIVLFERDEYISFANCGLPYYIGNVITDRNKLLVQTVEGMTERFRLDIRTFSEVTGVDRINKTVTVRKTMTGEIYTETYDVLILSPGAKPLKPSITGMQQADNLFTLRNIPDTDKIYRFIEHNAPQHAVVIGGGFIGVEMAENLRERGLHVTIIEKMSQVIPPLDFEMAQLVHQELNAHDIELILNNGVAGFEDQGKKVILEDGRIVPADLIVLAIGVVPENKLAKESGLAIGPRGHILTNSHLQPLDSVTKEPTADIYALGDAIEVQDFVSGNPTAIPLAWPANRQGRLVADHINGMDVSYNGSLGSAVLKVFNLTVASTGNNERQLKAKGIAYQAIHAHRSNHASYYPNPVNIVFKLLFDPLTGKIFGAQAVGQEGTEKRIDVIATAIKLGATVRQLPDLELCYAPPFSSAKDPVNILGYIASNVMDGVYKVVHWHEIDEIVQKGGYLLDVRTPEEFELGHIEGAVNIEVDSLRNRLSEITVSKDTPIYVTCQVGLRAYIAIKILKGHGYQNVYNLSGGYSTYKSAHYAVQKPRENAVSFPAPATPAAAPIDPENCKTVDVTGLQCPGPLLATYRAVSEAKQGENVRIIATDYGFVKDIENWCSTNGHTLISLNNEGNKYIAVVQKGQSESACSLSLPVPAQKNATIVLFSGELDKALAAMIIAQGAAAQGKNVTVFFTFWGLNVLRRDSKFHVQKNFIEKMFGFMMPRGSKKLPLSNMNMLGVGPKMIKSIMKKKNVDSLPDMIRSAMGLGIKFVACTMSMDLMGIKQEELIDGVEPGGVATYISHNENAGTTLFI